MSDLKFKVYFHEERGDCKEIRKFTLDKESKYEDVLSKIKSFETQKTQEQSDDAELFLKWKDEEGDFITISGNEELKIALESNNNADSHLKLFVYKKRVAKPQAESQKEHTGVTCDGCDQAIRGVRFKCTECYDFDLCQVCQAEGKHPEEHEMLCIQVPRAKHIYYASFPFGCPQVGRFRRGRPGRCNFQSKKSGCHQQTPEKAEENSKNCEEAIHNLASSFGLDPEVAVSTAKSMQDDLKESFDLQKEASSENTPQKEEMDVLIQNFSQIFGMEPHTVSKLVQTFSESFTCPNTTPTESSTPPSKEDVTQQEETDESEKQHTETPPGVRMKTSSNDNQEVKDDSDAKKPPPSSAGATNNQLPNFGEMMGNIIKQFSQNQGSPTNDFVMVDPEEQKKECDEAKMEKALRQMESMGFDNEGGWLKQLLIAKHGSIDKVLEALNPAN